MKAVPFQDSIFLMLERRQQPMHIGGLSIYTPPQGSGPDYVEQFYQNWRQYVTAQKPFNQRLVQQLGVWYWEEDREFDVDYHLRHLALPKPGRIRELLAIVSRLHGTLMDRTRPLWELSLIEGLADGRFAIYSKMHHSMVDGITAVKLAMSQHAFSAKETRLPIWAHQNDQSKVVAPKKSEGLLKQTLGSLQAGREILPGLASGLWELVRPADMNAILSKPFKAPPSPFNVPISGSRRFVAQSYSLERLKAIGKATNSTLNDVVLGVCSGALRRYLQEQAVLEPASLIAMVPVSLHGETDKGGNQVATILANLATNEGDPLRRLRRIMASTKAAKERMSKMVRLEKIAHNFMMLSPLLPDMLTGRAATRPAFNLVISNIPGSTKDMYLNGAHLDESYPISIPMEYQAVNITVTSYVDSMAFGFTACRRAVPNLQRMIDYVDQSLRELEAALRLSKKPTNLTDQGTVRTVKKSIEVKTMPITKIIRPATVKKASTTKTSIPAGKKPS